MSHFELAWNLIWNTLPVFCLHHGDTKISGCEHKPYCFFLFYLKCRVRGAVTRNPGRKWDCMPPTAIQLSVCPTCCYLVRDTLLSAALQYLISPFSPPSWSLSFHLCKLVGWLVCQQDCTKTTKLMSRKLGWRMDLGQEQSLLTSGVDLK